MNTKFKAFIAGATLAVSMAASADGLVCNYYMFHDKPQQQQGLCNYLQARISADDMWVFNNAMPPVSQRDFVLHVLKKSMGD